MGVLLQAEDLEIVYGQVSACRGLNFHIGDGEIVTLIGANEAGKSTTLRAIAGVLAPRTGVVSFNGADITRMPSYERYLAGSRGPAGVPLSHGARKPRTRRVQVPQGRR